MALFIVYDAATAILEQTSIPIEDFWGRGSFAGFLQFLVLLGNIVRADWVKMFGDSNGQIKLLAKQKYKFLSATSIK